MAAVTAVHNYDTPILNYRSDTGESSEYRRGEIPKGTQTRVGMEKLAQTLTENKLVIGRYGLVSRNKMQQLSPLFSPTALPPRPDLLSRPHPHTIPGMSQVACAQVDKNKIVLKTTRRNKAAIISACSNRVSSFSLFHVFCVSLLVNHLWSQLTFIKAKGGIFSET